MLTRALFLSAVIALTGCTREVIKYVEVPQTFIHPSRPTPIMSHPLEWKVFVIDKEPYVGLSYDQSLDLRLFLKDTTRYIGESNSILCFYRKDLLEPDCKSVDADEGSN